MTATKRGPRRIDEDWSAGAELGGGREPFRRKQWVAVVVLVLVLGLSGLAVLVPKLFRAAGSSALDRAGEQAELQADMDVLAACVEEWSVAHAGGLPQRVEDLAVPDEDGGGARLLDPWGRPYVIEAAGSGDAFRIVSLGADGRRGSDDVARELPRPLVLLVGAVDGSARFALGKRDTQSDDELEGWLRALLAKRGPDAALHVVAAPGTSRELSGRAADVALRAGFTDVGFAELAR